MKLRPCRRCHAPPGAFDIARDPHGKKFSPRRCLPCQRGYDRAYRARNLVERRRKDREGKKRRRVLAILGEGRG